MIEHSASPSRACSNEYLWLTGTDKPQCTCTATIEYSCKNCNATLIARTIVPSSVRQGTLSLLCVHDKVL